MVTLVKSKNPNAKNIEEIAEAFLKVGEKYGLRGDIAFCQSIIETGWFRFDGGTAVTPDQHNYCGLGVTSTGIKGAVFATVKDGVTAQIQHLYAYATKSALPAGETLLDPRFQYVTRGIAPNWEDLSNRWAMNANYGTQILNMYNQLLQVPASNNSPEKPNTPKPKEEKKDVLFTHSEINNKQYASVVIDGKGYIAVSDVADLLDLKVVFDKVTKEIIFIKK